ncbi:hypothetical protein T265_10238 [Opisthorchis viverrini]|uniref:Uncharacterized protein n=1 Tax=Opisthorchis viverrini TaxID=6198 RepID=A0A074ZDZ5_OPIVI|nr:hypothetical protein T265_10238 [Opisthorchis viverrini]KER21420.1 hypothetical protein T265_10238 [Opisthorchis viverrini]
MLKVAPRHSSASPVDDKREQEASASGCSTASGSPQQMCEAGNPLGLSVPQLGYHDTLVDSFAFADDWVACVESQTRLKAKLEAELGRASMEIIV